MKVSTCFRMMLPIMIIALLSTSPASARTGALVDDVIFTEQSSDAAAISQLEANEIDLYSYTITKSNLFDRVKQNPNLGYEISYGSFSEITFNPYFGQVLVDGKFNPNYGPFTEGRKLNPFAVPRIREAMNWLIDRTYMAEEIYGGLAVPRFTPFNTAFPDYARLSSVTRLIEIKYGHDPVKAEQIIAEEMTALGATKVNGKWHFNGEPVVLIGVIRNEDERALIGDYISSVLEDVGFTVDRQYKSAAEASPLWINGDPAKGLFHFYTGGWVTTAIVRDEGSNFLFHYTPAGLASPLWNAYNPKERFFTLAEKLANNDFRTMDERTELFAEALEYAMEDSVRIWTLDQTSFIPRRADLKVTSDLSGGISGTYLWARTIQKGDQIGGQIRIALPSMLPEPWNPLDGSNWVYDQMMIRGTSDVASITNPFTGLAMPNRFERAEVYVEKGLPVSKTFDWTHLEFVDEINVPTDAWADWDAKEQRFITVGEKYPNGINAKLKSVVYYPGDLYEHKWHDGSQLSAADFVYGMIISFDRANPDSAIYDKAQEPAFQAFMSAFRGVKIVSTHPLIIETYSDSYALDAENSMSTWWPQYAQGPGSWHGLTVGALAEANHELAFSKTKADATDVEWTNYIAGPSLSVLEKHLLEAKSDHHIPYAPTLGAYLSDAEVADRYENLSRWYEDKGHFWVGSGPLYLERAYPIEKQAHLKRFEDFKDPADKWALFAEPRIADVDVYGPGRIQIGSEALFDVEVTFNGEDYPTTDITAITWLLFNSNGELVSTGDAQAVEDGLWEIIISPNVTNLLPAGANKLEVVVAPIVVSIPSSDSVQFVTTR